VQLCGGLAFVGRLAAQRGARVKLGGGAEEAFPGFWDWDGCPSQQPPMGTSISKMLLNRRQSTKVQWYSCYIHELVYFVAFYRVVGLQIVPFAASKGQASVRWCWLGKFGWLVMPIMVLGCWVCRGATTASQPYGGRR
jgi:hypothetical protein